VSRSVLTRADTTAPYSSVKRQLFFPINDS
jgi:hypothetical protein